MKNIINLFSVIFILTVIFSAITYAGIQNTYYVDAVNGNDNNQGTFSQPFATIHKARDVVRTVNGNMSGDIIIYLRDGVYYAASPFTLGPSDSGTNNYNIIYSAYGSEKPVISGGKSLTGGWTLFDSAKNIYRKTDVNWRFRQLFVNGDWAVRARNPNTGNFSNGMGYYFGLGTNTYPFVINANYIGSWANNGICEMVWIC